jgi:iduronate 2-sulfatase
MKRTAFLTLVLAAFLLAAPGRAADPPRKPNVLFIVADDLNCTLGCYGDPVVKSPHIDRLAARGVRFDRSYCNYPVCNASRTSFLSGRYPDTTGVLGNGTEPRVRLGKEFRFLPEYYHDQGYFTAGIGKVAHGTFAKSVSWDVFAEPMRGIGDEDDLPAVPRGRRQNLDRNSVPFAWEATANKDEEEPDGQVARRVVKLLEQHKDGPFFIAAGFHKPHVPHVAPKKYFDLYPVDQMPLPQEPTGHAKEIPTIARPPKYFPDLSDTQKRQIIAHYHAATSFMDAQVGLLLDTMDRLKLWDNTVVVFLGDHGWHLGQHEGFWAKMSVMEESARAPLIVSAPGRKAGVVCERLVEFVDLFPTLTELCRLPAAVGVEGASFVPLLDDPTRAGKKAVFTVVNRRGRLGRAVRTETHTYVEWPDGSRQLYDHVRDAHEFVNLAKDEAAAATAAEMKQLLKAGPAGVRAAAPR